jgi:hypothetical protein
MNGREAKNGDMIVFIPKGGRPNIGILYNATPGNDYCNGNIAQMLQSDPYANLKECLYLDDVKEELKDFLVGKPPKEEIKEVK